MAPRRRGGFWASVKYCWGDPKNPKRKCLGPVGDQMGTNSCFAFAVRDSLYAEEYLEDKKCCEDAHLGSVQDLRDFVHTKYLPPTGQPGYFNDAEDLEYDERGIGNSLENTYKFVKTEGLLLDEDYKFDKTTFNFNQLELSDRPEGDKIFMEEFYPIDDDLEKIQAQIKICPVTAVLYSNAKLEYWKKSGVFKGPSKADMETLKTLKPRVEPHSVLVVGYGGRKGHEFFVIRNSYGPKWGYDGYGKVDAKLLADFHYPKGTKFKSRATQDKEKEEKQEQQDKKAKLGESSSQK